MDRGTVGSHQGWTKYFVTFGVVVCSTTIAACSNHASGGAGSTRDVLSADARGVEDNPGETRTVEEPDLYQLSGTRLLVQNPARGLAVIDVSAPDRPAVVAQLTSVVGKSGELFLRNDDAFIVFKESSTTVGKCELVAVRTATTTPVGVARLQVAGTLVASRLVGNVIYLVSSELDRTWVTSISVADPVAPTIVSQQLVPDPSQEAFVSDTSIFVAFKLGSPVFATRVQAFDIADPHGAIGVRGDVQLKGVPQGRFHMDLDGTRFRMVTFENRAVGSNLYVVDAHDLAHLTIQGRLEGFAPGEDLHATRFVGDRAYVVTYQPVVIELNWGGMDPLWVISLTDPSAPRVLGTLQVPGWSDYVFPRGDRLVAVGRGDLGARVAVSLYDIADPTRPTELKRLEFGTPLASSDANTDYRGARIVEPGVFGPTALIAVPYTNNQHVNGECAPDHHVQMIDLLKDDLVLRGQAPIVGLVRRAVPIGSFLYALSDKTVSAIDVSNRSTPVVPASVVTGDLSAREHCVPVFLDTPTVVVRSGCIAGPAVAPASPLAALPLALYVLVALVVRKRLYPESGSRRRRSLSTAS